MSENALLSANKSKIKIENRAQKQDNCLSQSISSPVEQILFLQRTIGNQAVEWFIRSGALQAKLNISTPGDMYEQEADRVAQQVMRMPAPEVQRVDAKYIPLELKDDSARFEGDKKLEDITIGADKVSKGARGLTVTKLQQALIDLRYLPANAVDGKFDAATMKELHAAFDTRQPRRPGTRSGTS